MGRLALRLRGSNLNRDSANNVYPLRRCVDPKGQGFKGETLVVKGTLLNTLFDCGIELA